jgi:2-methylfumaryl-CoA isomerase
MQNLLKGLRIVEGSAFIAAPSGGMTLGQLGADVIRFDQIGGGIDYRRWPITAQGKSLYWHSLNKGKRSIAVDFRKPEGRELLSRLICAPGDDGGLFLTNFPARGWLAYDALKRRREDLIYLNLTGDRHGGSALDYTVNARVGVPFLNGDGVTPLNSALPAWDVIAGQQIALGLLAAERHRSRTGEGQLITLALADVALATMGHLGYLAEAQLNENPRPAMGNHIFGTFGHDFLCADGERVMIVGVSPNQWQAIVKVTDCANVVAALASELDLNFDKEGDRFAARERLRSLFAPWFAARSSKQVHAALEDAGVCWGPYQTIKQLVGNDGECSIENPLFSSIDQPEIGRLLTPSQPLNFAGIESTEPKPAPRLGQHTDEILSEILEMSSGEIAALHDAKIVAAASS